MSFRTISVVIPAHNYGRFLGEALDSVFAQTYRAAEVIVVNDGSTDETTEVLARYGDRVTVIDQDQRGAAAARNRGIEQASGDLVAFLDADDVWLPAKLEKQQARFEAEPDLGLVHCGLEETSDNHATLQQRLDGQEGWVAEAMLLGRRPVILGGGSTALIPRAVFATVGEFDESLPPSEDWDFNFRVACRYRVGFVPEVLARYRLHGENSHFNVNAMERAAMRAYQKAFTLADEGRILKDYDPAGLARFRRRCYGNLHATLAGCYLSARQYREAFGHATASLFMGADNLTRVGGYLRRRWRRRAMQLGRSRAADGAVREPVTHGEAR